MPRVGPGDDNITGDRYTLDLGVEPDLGNLLQNLQVANDLLDAAEQKFRSISDVVNSSTQRMAQFTRQTALAAAEAQRLQNSYSQIASSSFTLANIGSMAGGMGGGMPGMYPGQMAFGGMPPVRQQNTLQTQASGVGGNREDIREYAPPPPARPPSFPLSVRAASLQSLERGVSGGSPLSRGIEKFRAGYGAGSWKAGTQAMGEDGGWGSKFRTAGNLAQGAQWAKAAVPNFFGAGATGAVESLPATGGGAGLLGGVGGLAARAAPWAGAAYAAYKLWAGQTAEARRLSGMTGNTTIFGGVGGGSARLKGRALFSSFVNPGLDYGRVQEEALGTGAVGQTYEQTRDFLFEAAKRGMSDSIDMVDLYQESVSKAGGTTEQLTNSLDRMRSVASVTNANLTAMTQNYKASMEQYIALGASGGAANFASLTQTTAYPTQSALARVSPVLRNSGGLDVSNPYLQAQVTSGLGIGYTQLGIEAYSNPAMAGKIPVYAEQAAQQGLRNYGFKKGMDGRAISSVFANLGGWPYAGQILAQQGLIPPDIDPNDQQSVISAIQVVMSGAVGKEYAETQNAGATRKATMERSTMAGGGTKVGGRGTVTVSATGEQYVNQTLGLDLTEGGFLGIGQHDNEFASLAHTYEKWIDDHGGRASNIMDTVLKSSTHGGDTYVRTPKGEYMKFEEFVNANPDWQALLNDEKSGYTMGTADESRARELNSGDLSTSDRNAMLSDITRQTGDQFAQGGPGATTDPNDVGLSVGSQGEFDLGEKTLGRLAEILNKED